MTVIRETRTYKKIGSNKVTVLDEGLGFKPRLVIQSADQSVMFTPGDVFELISFLSIHYPLGEKNASRVD